MLCSLISSGDIYLQYSPPPGGNIPQPAVVVDWVVVVLVKQQQ